MENALVHTGLGKIQGKNEGNTRIWKGIPFARPPVGKLRFQPPEPPKKWEGIRRAFSFGPVCPQNPSIGAMQGIKPGDMAEDCLYLNVWAPGEQKEKRPVMVWIHGGAFRSGAGSSSVYDGARLAAQGDLLVVTFNYRLGALGFLHLAGLDDSYTANLGLLDQIAALKWIKENIDAFGGDPEQITVFGESAGAMSIASLLAMPEAKGLFQKAILESGATQVLAPEQASRITHAVLHQLDIGINESLETLQNLPVEAIIQAGEKASQSLGGPEAVLLFQPVVDGETLPQYPTEAVREGGAENIPLLIGTNHDEGSFFFRPGTAPMAEAEVMDVLTKMMGKVAAERIKNYYPATIDGQAQFVTDFIFWKPALEFAAAQMQYAPVWMYRFDWHIPGHPYVGKAVHALEIPFVFNNLEYFLPLEVPIDETARQLARRMQDAWISFAHTGNPGPEWPSYSPVGRQTMIFDQENRVIQDPDPEKRILMIGG